MLELLRELSKTWVAKILLGVLVVAFGAFGIGNVITQLGTTTVARVGDQDISAQDFQRVYQAQINQVAQQLGKMPTPQEAMAMGIPNQVVTQLAADGALDKFGQTLGVGTSNDRASKLLHADPSFANALGQFDKQTFDAVLQQQGFTEAQFVDDTKKQGRRQQVASSLFGDINAPDAAVELINRYNGDTRTLSYFVLNTTNIPSIPDPTDADLTAYLKAHQADYRTKETRAVDLMTMSPTILAAGIKVPDDQVKAEYDKTKATLVKPEKRDIKQAVLTDAQAKTFEDGKTAGKSFDDLVKATNATVTDLGALAKTAISDTSLADTAFGLKQGEFALIPGIQGKRAVTVASIVPGGEASLDEARPDIEKRLAQQQATTEVGNDTDQIEDLRAGKQSLATIAPRYNLKVSSLALTADGAELASVPDIADADRAKITQAVFAARENAITPSVQLSSNQTVWFDLKSVTPARDQTLAEVHDALAAAWTKEKTDAAMKTEADKIVADLKSGKKFEDIAASLNQVPVLSEPITRQGDKTTAGTGSVLDGPVGKAAFDGGPSHFGYAVNGDGDYVLFQVEAVNPASGTLSSQIKTSVADSVRHSIYDNFLTGLVQTAGVRTNQAALNQALALNGS